MGRIVGLLLAVGFLLGSTYVVLRETAEEVQVVKARTMPFTHHLYATVEVRPQHVYEIGIFRDPAQIIKVHKEVGDWVEKNEAVLELSPDGIEIEKGISDLQLDIYRRRYEMPSTYESDLQKLVEDYELLKVRAEEGYASSEELRLAKIEVEKMENKIAEERFSLENWIRAWEVRASSDSYRLSSTKLVSSVTGTIIAVNKKIGEYLDVGETAFEVYENGVVEVIAKVSEEDYDSVFEGQAALVELQAFPGREFKGKVVKIYPTGNEINQQIDVEIELEVFPKEIIPGLTGIAKLVVEDMGPVLLIPSTAFFRDEIMVVKHGRIEVRKVGIRHKGLLYTVVSDGLKEGEVLLKEFDTGFRLDRRIREKW